MNKALQAGAVALALIASTSTPAAAAPQAGELAARPEPAMRVRAAPPPEIIISANPCKKDRFRKDCRSARQISRYGVEHFWEVVYIEEAGKWIAAEESEYGGNLDENCGRKGFAFLKKMAPAPERMAPDILSSAQDFKEQCELAQIRADGLDVVNTELGVHAKDLNEFRIFRLAKADLKNAPAAAQDMIARWLERANPATQ
jgi:hypothetical protein